MRNKGFALAGVGDERCKDLVFSHERAIGVEGVLFAVARAFALHGYRAECAWRQASSLCCEKVCT